MNSYFYPGDYGPNPCVINIAEMAMQNQNFRSTIWTGCHLQMTLMCIPGCGDIGLEMHEHVDQFLRIEQGQGMVKMGSSRCRQDIQQCVCKGDVIFVPAGTWHNIINTGRGDLKISSIYAPPNHRMGTVHRTKADAENEEMKR